jgi:hypothetical protein
VCDSVGPDALFDMEGNKYGRNEGKQKNVKVYITIEEASY